MDAQTRASLKYLHAVHLWWYFKGAIARESRLWNAHVEHNCEDSKDKFSWLHPLYFDFILI